MLGLTYNGYTYTRAHTHTYESSFSFVIVDGVTVVVVVAAAVAFNLVYVFRRVPFILSVWNYCTSARIAQHLPPCTFAKYIYRHHINLAHIMEQRLQSVALYFGTCAPLTKAHLYSMRYDMDGIFGMSYECVSLFSVFTQRSESHTYMYKQARYCTTIHDVCTMLLYSRVGYFFCVHVRFQKHFIHVRCTYI